VNLCAVLLRLCAPFINAMPGDKQFAYLQPAYLAAGRLALADDTTRMAATAAEASAWAAAAQAAHAGAAAAGASPGGGAAPAWSFVCESFFLTARAMHLGVIKAFSELNQTIQEAHREHRTVSELEASRASWEGTPSAAAAEGRLAEASAAVHALQQEVHMFVALLAEPRLVADTLSFYRLAARWLTHIARGGDAAGVAAGSARAVATPLRPPCPRDFACLPEHLAEDVAEALISISRHAPRMLEARLHCTFCPRVLSRRSRLPHALARAQGERLDEFMEFLVLFVGAPECVAACVAGSVPWARNRPSG
jgi:ubiquitin conjugation factor E4 B